MGTAARTKKPLKKRLFRLYLISRRKLSNRMYILKLKCSRRKWRPLTQDEIAHLRALDDSAYRGSSLLTDPYRDFDSLAALYGCIDPVQMEAHLGDDWYILLIHYPHYIEIADMAAQEGKAGNTLRFFRELTEVLRPYHDRQFLADCRDKTSFQIVDMLKKMHRLEVVWEEEKTRCGEPFHRIMFRLHLEQTQ